MRSAYRWIVRSWNARSGTVFFPERLPGCFGQNHERKSRDRPLANAQNIRARFGDTLQGDRDRLCRDQVPRPYHQVASAVSGSMCFPAALRHASQLSIEMVTPLHVGWERGCSYSSLCLRPCLRLSTSCSTTCLLVLMVANMDERDCAKKSARLLRHPKVTQISDS